MLSISPISSASGTSNYFNNDNYYTEGEEVKGEWYGKGAELLGLKGEVDEKTFENLLNGILPDGTQIGDPDKRRLGIDLTFSAPKSVSILALVGGDKRLIEAHKEAVKDALAYLEKNGIEARNYKKNPNGEPEKTGNLTTALYTHDTSRALDPQLHTHSVTMNATQTKEGTWKALWNENIYKLITTADHIYKNSLQEKVRPLGYGTYAKGKYGAFEINGVPQEAIKINSKRNTQINEKANELGIESAKGRGVVAVNSRQSKQPNVTRSELLANWNEAAQSIGFDPKAMVEEAIANSHTKQPFMETARQALDAMKERFSALRSNDIFVTSGVKSLGLSAKEIRAERVTASAIHHLSEREAAMHKKDILATALGFQVPGINSDDVSARINQLIAKGKLIEGFSERADGHVDMVTTPKILTMEKSILAMLKEGGDQANPLFSPTRAADELQGTSTTIAKQLGRSFQLNDDQMGAAIAILSGKDKHLLIQGNAGAGKSTMLRAVNQVLDQNAQKFLGLAFQNTQVNDLKDAGLKARTIASFTGKYLGAALHPNSERGIAAKAELKDTIIIIDEASMVSSVDMKNLLTVAKNLEVNKMIFMGDRKQLLAIAHGKMFSVAQDAKLPTAKMTQNIRQQNSPLLLTASALSNAGFIGESLKLLNDHGKVTEAGGDHIKATAEAWIALPADKRDETMILTAGRDDKNKINEDVQTALKEEGALKGDAHAVTILQSNNNTKEELRYSASYFAGDVLEVKYAVKEIGLKRGFYSVKEANDRQVILQDRNGKSHTIEPQKIQSGSRQNQLGLFLPKEIKLYEGDRVFWREKDARLGIDKASKSTITKLEKDFITLKLNNGESLKLSKEHAVFKKMDLAYALNAHMAQGLSPKGTIEHIASNQTNLANQRTQHVLQTRPQDSIQIITDNLDRLIGQIERNHGDKTSAAQITDKSLEGKDYNPKAYQKDQIALPDNLQKQIANLGKGAEAPSAAMPDKAPEKSKAAEPPAPKQNVPEKRIEREL